METLTLPSSFSNTAEYKEAFTWGDCGYLAVALSNATGFDVATVSADFPEAWVHAGVWLDREHIIDIKGIYHYQDWLSEWEWAADNGYGYETIAAVRWKAIDFLPSVMEMPRAFPDVDLDEAVSAVLANLG